MPTRRSVSAPISSRQVPRSSLHREPRPETVWRAKKRGSRRVTVTASKIVPISSKLRNQGWSWIRSSMARAADGRPTRSYNEGRGRMFAEHDWQDQGVQITMNRRLIIVPVLLMAGLGINVAVAWWCAAFVQLSPGVWRSDSGWFNGDVWGVSIGRAPGTCAVSFERGQRTGMPDDAVRNPSEALPRWCRSLTAATESYFRNGLEARYAEARGWPLLALWSERQLPIDENASEDLILGGFRVDGLPKKFPDDPAIVLPFRSIWSGLIINSALYAVLLWAVIVGPFWLRRFIRVRAG